MLQWLAIGAVAAAALLALFFRNFHRDPERVIPEGDNVVAPADGRVLDVIELPPGEPVDLPKGLVGRVKVLTDDLDPCPHVMIPIFMNPFNVHVQRVPISVRVLSTKEHPGKFLTANSVEAMQNLTVQTLMETDVGRIVVLQTAGFLVRHIHNDLRVGQEVRKGDRFGRIDFGSQVTLILPKKDFIRVVVKKGDSVLAGETVVATLDGNERSRAAMS
jgi:phosphatidylserine decarboxylase